MSEVTCDIVNDLIPLYVENLCSADSRTYVERHIADCPECRQAVELCRKNSFSVKNAEKHQLDGMKKIQAKIKRQKILIGFFLLLLAYFGMDLYAGSHWWRRGHLDFYLLFPFAILLYELLLPPIYHLNKPTRKEFISFALSAIISVGYIILFDYFLLTAIKTGHFGNIPLQSTGPILAFIFAALFSFQLALFIYSVYCRFRRDIDTGISGLASLAGLFILLGHTNLLYYMSDRDTFSLSVRTANIFFPAVGLIACLIHCALRLITDKISRRNPL